MSAPASRDPGFAWRLRQVPGALARCARPGTKLAALLATVLFGGLCLLVLAKSDKPQRELAALLLAAMATFTLWGLWFARLLPLQLQARQLRTPQLERVVLLALALLVLVGGLLPGLLLAWAGVPFWLALGTLVASACLAVLMGMLPPIGWLLLLPLPLALKGAAWLPVPMPEMPGLGAFAGLAPLLLALAIWRWRALLGDAGWQRRRGWLQPSLLATGAASARMTDLVSSAANAQLPDWLWPAGQVHGAGPQRPVRALRALLGTPFAPLSARQWLIQLGLMLGYVVLAACWLGFKASGEDVMASLLKGGQLGGVIGGALGGGGTLLLLYGQRLVEVYRKPGGELNELALLPGFGSAAAQRASLLRALWQTLGGVAVILLLLLAVPALLAGWELPRVLLLLATGLGLLLLIVLICLRSLAGLPAWGWRMQLLLWPLLPLTGLSWLYVLHGEHVAWALPPLAGAWLLAAALGGLLLASAWRKFQARPHPFLQD